MDSIQSPTSSTDHVRQHGKMSVSAELCESTPTAEAREFSSESIWQWTAQTIGMTHCLNFMNDSHTASKDITTFVAKFIAMVELSEVLACFFCTC